MKMNNGALSNYGRRLLTALIILSVFVDRHHTVMAQGTDFLFVDQVPLRGRG